MSESSLPLKGQVAVVTGASRGIGRSIALKLASDGADLVLSARGIEGVEAVAEAVAGDYPDRRVLPLGCDVSDWDSVSALVDRTVEEFERIDFLVNNAGITRDNLLLCLYLDADVSGLTIFGTVITSDILTLTFRVFYAALAYVVTAGVL